MLQRDPRVYLQVPGGQSAAGEDSIVAWATARRREFLYVKAWPKAFCWPPSAMTNQTRQHRQRVPDVP